MAYHIIIFIISIIIKNIRLSWRQPKLQGHGTKQLILSNPRKIGHLAKNWK